MPLSKRLRTFIDGLGVGRENTGRKGPRGLIREAHEAGAPVIYRKDGCYLAKNQDEFEDYLLEILLAVHEAQIRLQQLRDVQAYRENKEKVEAEIEREIKFIKLGRACFTRTRNINVEEWHESNDQAQ
jgi:hypothetical protein